MNHSIILKVDVTLQDLLTQRYRSMRDIVYPVDRRASIKDIIESMGIPHTEIGAVLRGEQGLPFSHIPAPGETFDLRALTAGTDVTQATLLRPDPLPGAAFAVDINVGKLARLLRMAGLDTWYDPGLDEAELADRAARGKRILLSRSRDMLKRANVTYGHLIRTQQPEEQLSEVIKLYGLQNSIKPFSRCLECNTLLQPVEKDQVLYRLEPLTRKYYHSFKLCPDCDRIYWQGSHYRRMKLVLQKAE